MGPGHLYYLLIFLTALLVAPFSPLARVIVLGWAAGEIGYLTGAPVVWVNLAQHLAALVIGSRYLRNAWSIAAWVMFLPMLTCDLLALAQLHPVLAWWGLLCTALAQLALLPMGMDTAHVRDTMRGGWPAYLKPRSKDFLRLG